MRSKALLAIRCYKAIAGLVRVDICLEFGIEVRQKIGEEHIRSGLRILIACCWLCDEKGSAATFGLVPGAESGAMARAQRAWSAVMDPTHGLLLSKESTTASN